MEILQTLGLGAIYLAYWTFIALCIGVFIKIIIWVIKK